MPNPFFGIITNPSSPLSFATVQRARLLRPFPQYDGVSAFRVPGANRSIMRMTLRLDKRFSGGLSLLSSYTWGKLIDDASTTVGFLGQAGAQQNAYDRASDRSISSQDITHRFVTSFVYDLPFGQGRSIGNSWTGPLNWVLGGWQVNGIVTFQSGLPLIITQAVNNTNLFSPTQRPTWTGADANISAGSVDKGEKIAALVRHERLQRDAGVPVRQRAAGHAEPARRRGEERRPVALQEQLFPRRQVERATPHRGVQRFQPGAVRHPEYAGRQQQLRRGQRHRQHARQVQVAVKLLF